MQRREFLKVSASAAATGALLPSSLGAALAGRRDPLYEISLAGWSLHRRHFHEKKLPLIDFPQVSREEFDIGAIELVNTMFPSPHYNFLRDLNGRAEKHDVRILLIMVDAEGDLSHGDEPHRLQAVRNHHKWVDIASVLGCHAIRVNTGGKAGDAGSIERCADSLSRLADHGEPQGISIICENHGGLSSHPQSMVAVLEKVGRDSVGTLPDFGNFPGDTDKYAAVAAMMPFAKAVSAKCYDFDAEGNETRIDFRRMMKIVVDAGYRGHVGIEYEGGRMSEHDGIRAARDPLQKVRDELAS